MTEVSSLVHTERIVNAPEKSINLISTLDYTPRDAFGVNAHYL